MRVWKETISPKYLHDTFGTYTGVWMPQMDRCWESDDGIQAMSRILFTEWGKVEHVAINRTGKEHFLSSDGSAGFSWAEKQSIKNELFGEDRIALEVFPAETHLVDVTDTYHLWILPKGFKMPFGIHPTKDIQCKPLNRGCIGNVAQLAENFRSLHPEGGTEEQEINPDRLLSALKTLEEGVARCEQLT